MSFRLLLTIYCLFKIQLSGQATIDDAHGAFTDLTAYLGNLADSMTQTIDLTILELKSQLDEEELEAIETVYSKASEARLAVYEIRSSAVLVGVDVSQCIRPTALWMTDFSQRLVKRATECKEQTLLALDYFVNETWSYVDNIQGAVMGCQAESLAQCSLMGEGSDCPDFVISRLEYSWDVLTRDFQLLTAKFVNKMAGFKLPCRDLLRFETSSYPTLFLKSLSNCVEVEIVHNLPFACT